MTSVVAGQIWQNKVGGHKIRVEALTLRDLSMWRVSLVENLKAHQQPMTWDMSETLITNQYRLLTGRSDLESEERYSVEQIREAFKTYAVAEEVGGAESLSERTLISALRGEY